MPRHRRLKLLCPAERERLLPCPRIDDDFFPIDLRRDGFPGPASPAPGARLAFFFAVMYRPWSTLSGTHEATVRVLTANGCEVCCSDGSTPNNSAARASPRNAGVLRLRARNFLRVKNREVFLGRGIRRHHHYLPLTGLRSTLQGVRAIVLRQGTRFFLSKPALVACKDSG